MRSSSTETTEWMDNGLNIERPSLFPACFPSTAGIFAAVKALFGFEALFGEIRKHRGLPLGKAPAAIMVEILDNNGGLPQDDDMTRIIIESRGVRHPS